MKRFKKHRVKEELPETSTSRLSSQKEHDLAYYIHDRVELMHQVFSVLKHKELRSMAPGCVRHISISDLQELCMEELLGISSKRLCAILDGATPPSDTESSSESEQLETISLDSISSDDEILSQVSTKKKKHKHRSKSKPKKRKTKDKDDEDEDKDQADRSRRAGLTVLELLELQARARAIRAQLQQEQASAVSTGQPSESVTGNSSDNEVEIKEETAEVVEISSEDEKPNVRELEERMTTRKEATVDISNSTTVTKKVNDLIITVPKTNNTRKIKLKRKPSTSIILKPDETAEKEKNTPKPSVVVNDATNVRSKASENRIATNSSVDVTESKTERPKVDAVKIKDKIKSKDKKKKRKKDKQKDKDGSDHDEIMLQLSDSEKMDLLEDLEGKKSEKCSETEDSSSDSSDDESVGENESDKDKISVNSEVRSINVAQDKEDIKDSKESKSNSEPVSKPSAEELSSDGKVDTQAVVNITPSDLEPETDISNMPVVEADLSNIKSNETDICDEENGDKNSDKQVLKEQSAESQFNESDDRDVESNENAMEATSSSEILEQTSVVNTSANIKDNIEVMEREQFEKSNEDEEMDNEKITEEISEEIRVTDKVLEDTISESNTEPTTVDKMPINEENKRKDLKQKSEGELSDRDSSEVEASDFKPDVVCISDDEDRKGKKKKKKDKKNKKDKKAKKKKDFRKSADQNFYSEIAKNVPDDLNISIINITDSNYSSKRDNVTIENTEGTRDIEVTIDPVKSEPKKVKFEERESVKVEVINTDTDFDDIVYETLELSDDSSCYEVEEISISKEPTAKEIEALSAKLDELERDRIDDEIEKPEELENVSWKDRYLKSSKVKKVLSTSNIMNAMRKKNLELKKKLQESKQEIVEEKEVESTSNFADGSIEQFNTLEASTKYVDPVQEVTEDTDKNGTGTKEKETVTKEMKKDAKQLLKMYKMLLKYNDMTKQKDPNRKRKKKKRSKDKDGVTG